MYNTTLLRLLLLIITLLYAHTVLAAYSLTYDPDDTWSAHDFTTISANFATNSFEVKNIASGSSALNSVAQGFIATETKDVSKISFLAHRLVEDTTISFKLYELLPNGSGIYDPGTATGGAHANKYRLSNTTYSTVVWDTATSIAITGDNAISSGNVGEKHFSLTDSVDGVLFSIEQDKHYAIEVFSSQVSGGAAERVTLWNYHDAGLGNEAAYADGRYGVPDSNTVPCRDLGFAMTYAVPELNTSALTLALMTLGALAMTRRRAIQSDMFNSSH